MVEPLKNERGAAMVLVLGVMAVLGILALVLVSLSTSEKWSARAEYTHQRAFYSADAASEAGVNWIDQQSNPPGIVDASNNVFVGPVTALSADHSFKFDVRFIQKRFRPGWSLEYKDYEYDVVADGTSAQQSEAGINVRAMRLFREGY